MINIVLRYAVYQLQISFEFQIFLDFITEKTLSFDVLTKNGNGIGDNGCKSEQAVNK